jgi:hypothetical protein
MVGFTLGQNSLNARFVILSMNLIASSRVEVGDNSIFDESFCVPDLTSNEQTDRQIKNKNFVTGFEKKIKLYFKCNVKVLKIEF